MSCECPVCGQVFAARNSVVGHMCSLTDDDHSGIGHQKAQSMIDDNEETADDTQPEAETGTGTDDDGSTDGSQTDTEPAETTTDGSPARCPPEPDVESEPTENTDENTDEPGGCPKCGADGTPTDGLLGRDDVPSETAEYLARNFDRICLSCSTASTAEVWTDE